MSKLRSLFWTVLLTVLAATEAAAVPALLNHQGRIAVGSTNFEGTGLFKFALVNTTGSITYWSNDGTSTAGGQPAAAVSLPVVKGLYSVLLGDTTLASMTAIPAGIFDNNADVRLRVWFNDGVNGSQQITPDQRLAAAPYALAAERAALATTVPDGAITGAKIADGSIANVDIAGAAAIADTKLAAITTAGKVANSATSGTAANTPGTLVLRDASGNFAAGTITGTFAGNGSGLTSLSGASLSAGSVTLDALAGNSVDASKIADGSIANADIAGAAAIADTKLAAITTAGKVANSATTGTAANTPGTLVLRDASGNFAAGTITGTFVGDGSGLTGVGGGGPSQLLLENVLAAPLKPVVAWGKNSSGQTTVPPLANVAAVAAGGAQSLALLDNGTVIVWGGTAAVPGGLVNVTHIAAGTTHALARKSDGTVVAWGGNTFGQATVPGGINNATQVAAGEKHSLILRATGTVTPWGDNTFGQTTVPGGLAGVTAIASGYDHCLALKADGTVAAWGRNDVGQATVPGGLANVVAIAAGAYHSLAVKGDGTVVAWGWPTGGQSTVPPGLTGVTKVAGGYAFSVALKSDGTLVTWGDNSDGQTTVPAAAAQVTALAAGESHMLVLRADLIPAQVARLDQENVFTGSLGIQRAPAANALEVEGQASKTTAGNWLANSDRRIKTDIQPVRGALKKLDQVRLVDFRYTEAYRSAHPGVADKRYLNVIAQEFAKVFPDHVQGSGDKLPDGSEILQVDTYPLIICSAAAVQELHRENEALKKALSAQEERLRRLETLLNPPQPGRP